MDLRKELKKVIDAMNSCLTDSGIIRAEHRHRYQLLAQKKNAIDEVLSWVEGGAL